MSLDSGLAPPELAPTLDIRSGRALSRLGTLISETTIETFAQATKMQYLEKGIIRHNLLFFRHSFSLQENSNRWKSCSLLFFSLARASKSQDSI